MDGIDKFKKNVVKARTEKARALGIECGRETLEVAGSDPTNCEGASMLPIEPQEGDWDYLNDTLKGGATCDEADAFKDAFVETVQGK